MIITQICRKAKCYFTSISNTWYLITAPNINEINIFFSEISQQIHKMYEKLTIITQIIQSQIIFHKHKQCMVPDNWSIYEERPHIPLWDTTRNILKLWTNCHNYSNVAQSQILFYRHQWPIVPHHHTQYEENPSSHHGGVCKDGHPDCKMDWRTGPFPIFPNSA